MANENNEAPESGTLYVVATPIGNLGDIGSRTVEVLQAVNLVAAEDTRHSAQLLKSLGVNNRLVSFHDHSSQSRLLSLLSLLEDGQSIALVSDAGTPAISDPGFELVRQARRQSIPVVPIPGPSAVTAALSVAGIASDRFVFEGFLPAKVNARQARLKELREEERTIVLFESPHRILATLEDLQQIFGPERPMYLGRELTKMYETSITGSIAYCHEVVRGDANQRRGEFVLVLSGRPVAETEELQMREGLRILPLLMQEMSLTHAAKLASRISGAGRNALYEAGMALQQEPN